MRRGRLSLLILTVAFMACSVTPTPVPIPTPTATPTPQPTPPPWDTTATCIEMWIKPSGIVTCDGKPCVPDTDECDGDICHCTVAVTTHG